MDNFKSLLNEITAAHTTLAKTLADVNAAQQRATDLQQQFTAAQQTATKLQEQLQEQRVSLKQKVEALSAEVEKI